MAAGVFCSIAFASAFVCAFLAGRGVCRGVRRALTAEAAVVAFPIGSAASVLQHAPAGLRDFATNAWRVVLHYLRNGVASFDLAGKCLLLLPSFRAMFEDASRLAGRIGVHTNPSNLASAAGAACFVTAFAAAAVLKSPFAALLAPVLGMLVFHAWLSKGIDREREILREQVPDALRCMEACMHAGLSLPQTFYEVAQQVDQPAKRVFQNVSRDLDMGYSVKVALERFRSVAALPELAFLAMALDVQYASGGSAAPILRSAEQSISRDLDLRRSLRVQTAQAKLSAQIVSIMPFALAFLITAVDPGFLAPFFENVLGISVLAVAVGMQMLGVILVRRMLAVEI